MKVILNNLLLLMMFLFGAFTAVAGPTPPSPTGRRRPPPPPGLPIDENIYLLVILAILFGAYIIYNHNEKARKTA